MRQSWNYPLGAGHNHHSALMAYRQSFTGLTAAGEEITDLNPSPARPSFVGLSADRVRTPPLAAHFGRAANRLTLKSQGVYRLFPTAYITVDSTTFDGVLRVSFASTQAHYNEIWVPILPGQKRGSSALSMTWGVQSPAEMFARVDSYERDGVTHSPIDVSIFLEFTADYVGPLTSVEPIT